MWHMSIYQQAFNGWVLHLFHSEIGSILMQKHAFLGKFTASRMK